MGIITWVLGNIQGSNIQSSTKLLGRILPWCTVLYDRDTVGDYP